MTPSVELRQKRRQQHCFCEVELQMFGVASCDGGPRLRHNMMRQLRTDVEIKTRCIQTHVEIKIETHYAAQPQKESREVELRCRASEDPMS